MSQPPRIDYILCEGYLDRAFWKGLLIHLGWTSMEKREGQGPVRDLLNRSVSAGRFLFRKNGQRDVIVQPVQGIDRIKDEALLLLGKDDRPEIGKVVINLDSDEELSLASNSAISRIHGIVRQVGGQVAEGNGPHRVGNVRVYPVIWKTNGSLPDRGLPAKETLERVIAGAICRAYPERGPIVQGWLEKTPTGKVTTGKSYTYSYFAKWYAEHGEEFFYQAPWIDAKVAAELVAILTAAGAWGSILKFDEE